MISHALDGADSLTLDEFVRHYFEKFGHTHSVELRYGKCKYLGHTVLYLPTDESKSTSAVSLTTVISEGVDLSDSSVEVVKFILDDLTVTLVEKLVEGIKLNRHQEDTYELALTQLQYAKEVADKSNNFVYYKSALEFLLEIKSKYSWGFYPLELVCKDNLVRGDLKQMFPTAIKKMTNDNLVYSLEELLSEVD